MIYRPTAKFFTFWLSLVALLDYNQLPGFTGGMKLFIFCLCLLAGVTPVRSETITRWYFNSTWPDGQVGIGTLDPSNGWGYALPEGEISTSFASGDTAAGRDPAGAVDNSAWSTTKYPAATNVNKTAGVRFHASTEGYSQITISWVQRNSSTASRFTRLQYSLDGVNFQDGPVFALTTGSVFTPCVVSLAGAPGTANNPWFAFRLVTEWQSTATGAGYDGYVATVDGSDYSTAGTMRFDAVAVSGTLLPGGNNPPVISAFPPQTLRVSQVGDPIGFTVLDAEDPASSLGLGAETSDPDVVPPGTIMFGGSGPNRTITVRAGTRPGSASVLVRVTDSGGKSASSSFTVTVLPANCEPVISPIPATNLLANTFVTIPFQVSDLESKAEMLAVQAWSSNTVLVPASGLLLGGSGSNRWLRVTPNPAEAGVAPIAVTVSDGAKTSTAVFPALVRPASEVLAFDPFAYSDGALSINSAGLWACHSGIPAQTQVANGEVSLSLTNTEDLALTLPGGPYVVSNRTVLYASFRLAMAALPRKGTGPLAHFGNGNSMLGRLYVSSTNATPGFYRMLISNGSGTPVELPKDLETNTYWRVVMRYDIDTATASFWINPRFDYDRDAWATDRIDASRVTYFGLRQGNDIGGDMVIDDVRVGLSFPAVTSTSVPVATKLLSAQRQGGQMILRWNHPAAVLQYGFSPLGPFSDSVAASPYTQNLSGVGRFFRLK